MTGTSLDLNLVREYFDYHPDGYLINKITRGRTALAGRRTCKVDVKQYRQVVFFGRILREHILIWIWHYGVWPDNIDHIDHNRLNNKIENLRSVTHKENIRHGSGKRSGVFFDRKRNNYNAHIYVDCKRKHLGVFKTYEEALERRLQGERELWQVNV